MTKGYPRYKIHGMAHTSEYKIWTGMKGRCLNRNNPRWNSYGGRGITVCERWINSFQNFYTDIGPRPIGTSLERIDNDGNYEPSNCTWATPKQQLNNTRKNIVIEHLEQRKNLSEWESETGIPRHTIYTRLKRGWTSPEIFSRDTTKARKRRGAKLTIPSVQLLRIDLESGTPIAKIARKFHVSETSVYDIAAGRTWKNVLIAGKGE